MLVAFGTTAFPPVIGPDDDGYNSEYQQDDKQFDGEAFFLMGSLRIFWVVIVQICADGLYTSQHSLVPVFVLEEWHHVA